MPSVQGMQQEGKHYSSHSWVCLGLPLSVFFHLGPIYLSKLNKFWPHHSECGILVPQLRIKLAPPSGEVRSLNPWMAMESPRKVFYTEVKQLNF